MSKCIAFCLVLLSSKTYMAQNMVPNPSFEDTISCWYPAYWYNVWATPDYYNPCGGAAAPQNLGYQQPYDGNSFAGIINYRVTDQSWREYLGVELTNPLISGTKYYVSAYISLRPMSSLISPIPSPCATNNFGFKFSNVRYEYAGYPGLLMDNTSHVHSDDIITDTLGWARISGSFVADSNYHYLMIGNFYDHAHTNTLNCQDEGYYYIDLVCVTTDSTLGNSSQKFPSVQIVPNPVTEKLTLLNLDQNTDYYLFNSMGESIQKGIITKDSWIDVHDLPNGLYFILIDERRFKFLIEH